MAAPVIPAAIKAAKLAAAVLSDKRARKAAGAILTAILSPLILIIVVLVSIFGGGADHNHAAVQYAYTGGGLPSNAPAEFKAYMNSMKDCFAGLDAAIQNINKETEDGVSLNSARVKAVFYATHYGRESLSFKADYYKGFAGCFARYEERERELETTSAGGKPTTEKYTVAVPVSNLWDVYAGLETFLGRSITGDERENAQRIYNAMLYGDNIITDDYGDDGYWSNGLPDTEIQYIGSGAETQVVYFNQMDKRWGAEPYGKSGTIASSGCGPTSLSMVVSTLTGRVVNPSEMARWAYQNGYRVEGSGSSHSLMPEGGRHFGLKVEGTAAAESQKIVDALANGKLVVAVMARGHFTSKGHFIVLRGVTSSGEILVADPASVKRSGQPWPLSIILDEARKDAGAGGPFWIFSNP